MPSQEIFLDQQIGERRIQVVKTYDEQYAREAFATIDEAAQVHLWKALDIDSGYQPSDIPADEPGRADLLLEEMLRAGREDWNTFSYFVVTVTTAGVSQAVYVSPDWPSAEAYVKFLPETDLWATGLSNPVGQAPKARAD
jgi:hypothetical protein